MKPKKRKELIFSKILQRSVDFKHLIFTDEYRFDFGGYTRDWIRLDSNLTQKLKNGNSEVYNLINRSIKKLSQPYSC